jgi:hypothetical protein
MAVTQKDEKSAVMVEHVDNKLTLSPSEPEELKPVHEEQLDRFGAHAKTDPKEIALVKKLDLYMLVCVEITTTFWLSLILCAANSMAHVLSQLP